MYWGQKYFSEKLKRTNTSRRKRCHGTRRVLGGATKVEPGTIRVGGEQLLAITVDLFARNITQED